MNEDLLAQFLQGGGEGGEGGAALDGGGEGGAGGEGTGEGGAGGEGSGATEKLLAKVISQSEELKTQNAQLQQQIKAFTEREIAPKPGTEPFMPAQPGGDQLAQVKDALNRKFMTDPGGALLDMLGMMQQITAKQTESMQMPLAQAQSQMILDGFLASKKNEPYFDKVQSEFNSIIERAVKERGVNLGKLAPEQLRAGLEDTWEQAVGRAAIKGGAGRSAPPPYSTGQGGGAGNFATHRGGALDALEARDPVEEVIIDTMRGVPGITDDDIKATLRAHREDNG